MHKPARVRGAMDLVHGATRVIVLERTDRGGASKILRQCTLPLTGQRVAARIITNLGVIDVPGDGTLLLRETARGVTVADVIAATDAELIEALQ